MRLLISILLFVVTFGYSFAQEAEDIYLKASPTLFKYLNDRDKGRDAAMSRPFADTVRAIGVLITTNDTARVAEWLEARGCDINTRLSHAMTAYIDANDIDSLLALPEVAGVSAFNKRKPSLDMVRDYTGANTVVDGLGLYAPYTGKGVVVGVIDMGFLYTHPAFRNADGSSRIIAARQMESGKKHNPLTTSDEILRKGDDGFEESHATHVTGIAAGGRDAIHSEYYGIAPDADIVAISCNELNDDEVIDGINYIASVAKEQGKPYVVNMSFGDMTCTHNGRGAFSSAINEMTGAGAILVAAVGNDGGKMRHARGTFASTRDSVMLCVPDIGEDIAVYIASEDSSPLTVRAYKYNSSTKKISFLNNLTLQRNNSFIQKSTEPASKQEIVTCGFDVSSVFSKNTSNYDCIAIAIKGRENKSFDAWIADGENEFGKTSDTRFKITPDDSYCISSPADAESVISVTSHAVRKYFTNIEGNTYTSSSVKQNDHASYASLGPLPNSSVQKPTVSAPGSFVISSVSNKNGIYTGNSSLKINLTLQTTYDGQSYYYAVNSGTSMACPVVSGAVALWLEAAPDLTPKQVMEIIERTSRSDTYTGSVPNDTWGYGKIDIYEGLKDALTISSIPSVRNSEIPFTLQASTDHWSVLLNTDEDHIIASLYDSKGQRLWTHTEDNISRGHDFTLPTAQLPKGVYILQLVSANYRHSQKIVVK